MKYGKVYFFSILIFLVLIVIFSQKRNSRKEILKININFNGESPKFIDYETVNKLLIQRKDTSFFLNKDMLDLRKVEDLLISNPMVARADIFRTPQGFLNVKLEERKPIARIINNNEEFYIDNFGYRVPISNNYSARVPIFYGEIDNNLEDIVNFIKLIEMDSFAKVEIIDLRNLNNSYVLGLRSFPFKIIWGKNSRYGQKIKKLKHLYSYLENKDFIDIDKVNLSFDKQIVLDYGKK